MKILLLTKAPAEIVGEELLLREISKSGVSMTVIVPGGRWRGTSAIVQRLKPHGYQLIVSNCAFTRIDSVRIRTHIYYYHGISQVLRSEKWNLVHVEEEACNLATYLAVRESCRRRIPVVFSSGKTIFQNFPVPFNFFEKYVYKSATGAVVGGSNAMDVLRRKGFDKPAERIQLGLDPNMFRKVDASALRDKWSLTKSFVVGFAGQVVRRKGLDTLMKALALLPNDSALVLVGSGPDFAHFKLLAIELGISERVRWEPWADHREITKFMCAFDAFVLPSRTTKTWREDFGRVLIEAMACETPVVGSDSGEIPHVIGDAGLIFSEGNEQELARHLHRLMDDSSLRESLGRRGRERVLEHFTYSKVAAQRVDFYQRMCSEKG